MPSSPDQALPATKRAEPSASPREWTPRIWEGCDFFGWMRLLIRNRFAVSWPHLYIPLFVTTASIIHSFLRFTTGALYGPAIRKVRLEPPLFVLGHWRSGTTLLHELLILDERHAYPTTFSTLAPSHFLLTEDFWSWFLWFLMPTRRPMDNMAAGWDRPQEDEFALALLGQPSPYLTIAFPNHPPMDGEAFDLAGLSPRQLRHWKRTWLHYLQSLTLRRPGRLVLKSPTHTARLPALLELFPDAHFVHVVRDPRVVIPSTLHLWRTMYQAHGLQTPTFAGLEELVFSNFEQLFARLEEGKALIKAGHFHELRYEDLVRDPEGQIRLLYEGLNLGGFDRVLPRLENYLAATRDYQTNRYEPPHELLAAIERRCGQVISRYGYPYAKRSRTAG